MSFSFQVSQFGQQKLSLMNEIFEMYLFDFDTESN